MLKCVLVNKLNTWAVQTSAYCNVPCFFSSLILNDYVRWQKRMSCTMSVACQRNYIRYGICFGGWTVRRLNPGGGRDFPHPSRPALGPSQPPPQWVPGLSRGLKWPERGVDHLPTSSAEVREWVKLYIYSLYGPSWPLLGWNVMYDISLSSITRYEGGPKNNRNLNVARELEVVTRCAARCRESTQYSSSLPRGVSLGWVLLLLWLFF
jgi:hypothetical protein